MFLGISVTAARAMGGSQLLGDTPTRATIKDGSSLAGLRVAVQGLGHVGRAVAEHLLNAGAEVVVSDLSADKLGSFLAAHPEFEAGDLTHALPEKWHADAEGGMFQILPHRHGTEGFFLARFDRRRG